MTRTLWATACCAVLLSTGAGFATELSDRICPILEQIAKESEGQASFMVQAALVMQVGGAYDFQPEPLKTVLADVDEATIAACPDARTAVLKLAEKDTLAAAMR